MKCQNCGGEVTGYGKKYCSRSCGVSANNRRYPKRGKSPRTPCVVCQLPCLYRTCSLRCHQRFLYLEYIECWKQGAVSGGTHHGVSSHIKRYLAETRGERCELCGWSEVHPTTGHIPIEVHHLQSNDDHTESNLQLLCPNHHALTLNYRALNKGRGRSFRHKRRA